jgi:hypothetical protein
MNQPVGFEGFLKPISVKCSFGKLVGKERKRTRKVNKSRGFTDREALGKYQNKSRAT